MSTTHGGGGFSFPFDRGQEGSDVCLVLQPLVDVERIIAEAKKPIMGLA